MSGKEKTGVVHRPNRGRSAPDSKSKTDSGCFVDDEIERNGSSDSSHGSISSPPVKEKAPKKCRAANKESLANTDSASVASSASIATETNCASRHVAGKENVMNGEVITKGENGTVVTDSVNGVCDVLEKTRRASDFYCLYYSESPEGTLTTSEGVNLRRKPPVPPKPKIRRGSAPPSSFNHIDRLVTENKDLTKRFSYNGSLSEYKAVNGEHEEVQEHVKLNSVESRVHFFEAFAKDGSNGGTFSKNVQTSSVKHSSYVDGSKDFALDSCSNLHPVLSCHDQAENIVPLADNETFSLESDIDYSESFNVHLEADVHSPQQFVPLVEEEEFAINGSSCFQSYVNSSSASEKLHDNSIENEKARLECVSEDEEVDIQGKFVPVVDRDGDNIAAHEINHSYLATAASILPEQNVMESCKARGSGLLTTKASGNDVQFSDIFSPLHDFVQIEQPSAGSSEKLLNPQVNELKQELLIQARSCDRKKAQRRPGSVADLPNWEKGCTTSDLKRRSWSFSESSPIDVDSPFVRRISQIPAPKLTTSSWCSESGLSYPYVNSVQDQLQSTSTRRNILRGKFGEADHCTASASNLEYSGYTSDESSVHSEPLFQPLRCRPQDFRRGHIPKSMSLDSSICLTDNERSTIPKVQRRRARHSLGSQDPFNALKRQSIEFATYDQPPLFRPVSPAQVPRLETLRRASSYTSSSSDSEVEKIFKPPNFRTQGYQHDTIGAVHNGIVNAVTHRKVSAMEALFGPQSLENGHCSDSELFRIKTLSERFSEVSQPPLSGGIFISEQLQEEELAGLKEGGEPGLEFDDTDYSEFYTRCEDKDSLISAEALSIKKLLQSPQTVSLDPDIESVVLSVTERKLSKATSENKEPHEIQTGLCENDTACVTGTVPEHETVEQFYRRHRGTQTPPPAVFKALNPPPSVATQTPPVNFQQELPSSLLKELELQIKTPTIKRVSPTPLESQQQNLSSLGQFQPIGSSSAAVDNTDLLSPPQESDKAVSVEELLQILAGMQVGTPKETVPRRPVSVQKYNWPSPQNDNTFERPNKAPKSLPSSWQHLSQPTGKKNDNNGSKKPDYILPRSSKSYDCLRRGHSARERRANVIEEKTLRRSESSENIRKSLREWKLRAGVFEEEVECQENREDKFKKLKCKEEKVLKVSFNGSESTDSIETQSKLTNTHSLKRPRKDRAFSQKEKNQADNSSLDVKQSVSAQNTKDKVTGMEVELSDIDFKESTSDHGGDSGILEVTSPAEGFQNRNQGTLCHEVASPEGIDVFIDYRKKHGMHITSTPKPTLNSVQKEEEGGKINFDEFDDAQPEKPVISTTKEDKHAISDVESQGDASSSSYSSDDDRFGEFGGSTETVVFVDTEPCPGMSLVGTDLETLDIDLVGSSDKLLSVNDNDEEKDESHLDALLGEVRRSLNLEFVDSDILDKAIDRFKKRVSPSSQNKALSGGLSMEAYVALHQADELQGIISEIKGELKLLHDENDMLRKEVVSLANQQTSGEATENSSTESSERLENICRLYRPRQADTDDVEPVEIDVCLRGFSALPIGHISSKKKDIHLGTVTVNGADWNGVMEAARKTFVDHMKKIDPENYLCLGAHSIQGVQTGVVVWSPGSLQRSSPRLELSNKNNPCVIQLKDGSQFSCDSLVYDTLLPKEIIENYVEQLLEHRCIVLCGQQGLGKSYLAAKLAKHVVQRIGWKTSPAVVTFNVTQTTRKELKQGLAPLMEIDISSSNKDKPAVIILDQLNCLASLADIFDFAQLEKNSHCPYIIGVRDKSRKGPFSSKELSLCHYFRWLRVSVNDRQYSGVLSRFLRRKLSWSEVETNVESDDLSELFDWLSKVWYHLNEILEDFCDSDATIGPSLFYSCPMDFKVAEGWFVNVWNYNVIPYLHQTLRSGRKIFDRCVSWEDPTKWVVLRYPWNKDHSRVFHTLRKLRQVDVVLNRNQLGSDNVTFAECIEDNEKILRAHSSVSKRVRTVVQEKIPKGELQTKRRTAERRDSHGEDCDRESSYSESDSYMETSI